MTIEVTWDDDTNTTLLYTVYNGWTWDDLYRAMDVGRALAVEQPHPVDSIIDLSRVTMVLAGGLPHFARRARTPRAYRGLVVLAGMHNPVLKAISAAVARMFPKASQNLVYTDTVEEGRALLRRSRQGASNSGDSETNATRA